MNLLFFPYLITRLCFYNFFFLSKAIFQDKSRQKILIISLVFLTIFLTTLFLIKKPNPITQETPPPTIISNSFIDLKQQNTYQVINNEEMIFLEIEKYKKFLNKQIKNKNILINLAILSNAVDQKTEATHYLEMATKLDPNNPLLKQD